MRCDEAERLFNTHLDGELNPALVAELRAHCLQCPDCRRELAIQEVTGHLIAAPDEPVVLRHDFTERLLACVETPVQRWLARVRRGAYVAVPLAAAAMIALAFVGVFDRGRESVVAGVRVEPAGSKATAPSATGLDPESADRAMDEWVTQMRSRVQRKSDSGRSLQKAFDLTILQVLDILEEANDGSAAPMLQPAASDEDSFPPDARSDEVEPEGVEDL